MAQDFVHLHTHSHFSILDGMSSPEDLAEEAKAKGFGALALTDHGSCAGLLSFQKACIARGIKPILGNEAYITADHELKSKDTRTYHVVLLAKNHIGIQHLMKLASEAELIGKYRKPRIDLNLLDTYHEGLICLSACPVGELSMALWEHGEDTAMKIADNYRQIFGDDYYIEIMTHKYNENSKDQEMRERKVARQLVQLAKKMGIKLVATNDIHYASSGQAGYHDVMLAMQTHAIIKDPKRFTFNSKDFYMKSYEEMLDIYHSIPQVLTNTMEIAEKVSAEPLLTFSDDLLPHFSLPEGFETEDAYLKEIVADGMKTKGLLGKPEYVDRIQFEMDTILKCGYTRYFLVLWDVINYARSQNIRIGVGRGSCVGSLCLYVLGVTGLDPIKYDLLFERFLNPDRVSPPDVDVDFDYYRRDEVYDYLKQKYGHDHCAKIGTYGTFKARSAVRFTAKALDVGNDWEANQRMKAKGITGRQSKRSLDIADDLAKLVPEGPGIKLLETYKSNSDFRSAIDQYPPIYDCARHMEGKVSNAGVHPAGIIVCANPITDHIPLRDSKGQICSQFDGPEVEELGLLKFDFLALKNLTLIDGTVKLVQERQGVDIDVDNLEPNDPKVFALLNHDRSGVTNNGIFQFEGDGISRLLSDLHVDNFEDMIVANALYRPGPLGAGVHNDYCSYKHGRKKISPRHPKMLDVLHKTYGMMCFDGRQPVYTNIGPLKIADLGSQPVWHSNTFKTECSDTKHGSFESGCKDVYEYVLSNGKRLYATSDHLILCMDGIYREIQDVFCNNYTIPLVTGHIDSEGYKTDFDRFYLFGALIGDGGLTHTNIRFCCGKNKEYGEIVGGMFKKLYPDGDYHMHFSTRSWYTNFVFENNKTKFGMNKSNRLSEDLILMGLKCKGDKKRIPFKHIYENRESYLALLGGLIDTDGHIGTDIRYSSANNDLLEDVEYLLWRLGYESYRSGHNVIVHRSADLFYELVDYLILKGNSSVPICNGDRMLVDGGMVLQKINSDIAASGLSIKGYCRKNNINASSLFRLRKGLKTCQASTFKGVLGPVRNFLCLQIVESNYVGKRKVYDLSVSHEDHNFFASGIIVHNCYQEDFMKVAQELAGFTKGQSDTLRKAVGKKKEDLLRAQREDFVKGCMHNGIDQKTANLIFDDIEYFGGYGFNKSHSAAYSFIAYQCAYLKTYYPLEFMCNLLTSEIRNSDSGKKLKAYTAETKRMGLKVAGVNINRSKTHYVVEDRTVVKEGKSAIASFIRTPLTIIKGVGEKAVDEIVANQPFKTLHDFVSRVDGRKVTSRVFESLVQSGCMDGEWGLSRQEILGRVDEIRDSVKAETRQQKKFDDYQKSFGGSMFDLL